VAALNIRGYFDGLLRLLDGAVVEGFLSPGYRDLLLVGTGAGSLLARLDAWEAPE